MPRRTHRRAQKPKSKFARRKRLRSKRRDGRSKGTE